MTKKPKSLYRKQEIKINPLTIILGAFLFALLFWVIGSIFRYYIPMGV